MNHSSGEVQSFHSKEGKVLTSGLSNHFPGRIGLLEMSGDMFCFLVH